MPQTAARSRSGKIFSHASFPRWHFASGRSCLAELAVDSMPAGLLDDAELVASG
jgi:hypothetical protein